MEQYNTTPMAPGSATGASTEAVAPVATMTQKARDRSNTPLTEQDLANYRRRGRLQAFLVILGSFALLGFNHFSAIHDHRIYFKAIYGGSMILAAGVFGLFQPLIMFRHLPVGKQFPKHVTALMLLAMAIGLVIGWQIHMYYTGGRF
jgi:hypothetical protein